MNAAIFRATPGFVWEMLQEVTSSNQLTEPRGESVAAPLESSIGLGGESTQQDHELEQLFCRQLAIQLGDDTFDLWFSADKVIVCDSVRQTITIAAEHEFSLNRLKSSFGRNIRKITDLVCGQNFTVNFVVNQASDSDDEHKPEGQGTQNPEPVNNTLVPSSDAPSELPAKPNSFKPQTPASRTLRSFYFGEENNLIEAAAGRLQMQPGEFNPLFIHGPSGCGKTHLLEGLVADTRRKLRLKRCVYLTSEQFTSLFIQSLRGSGLPIFRRKYRDLDILAIDDVQFFANKKATIGEFQFTIDNLIRMGKQIILSADCPPFELDGFQDELITRMSSGLVCPLKYPDEEGRIKIAQRMCAERNLTLSRSVIELVANRLTRDVRRISGAINRLHALQVATGRKVTDDLAEQALSDLFAIACSNSSMTKIEKVVCEVCGVKAAELKSSCRKKRICTARMLAMFLSRKYTSSAYSEIGDHYGNRSHSTVIAADKKAEKMIEEDKHIELPNAKYPIRDVISRIESKLRVG